MTLYDFLKPPAVCLMRLWFRLESRGREHVPATGPVLVVSNHQSVLDPPLIGGAAPRRLSFLAKAELFRIPLLGRLIHALGARPVRREGADAQALRTALATLQAGEALLVFPEGTRSETGRLGEAKAGAGMLAVLSGAPVVPVYIAGTGRSLPRGGAVPRPVKVRVRFGPAMRFEAARGDVRKERYREVAGQMMHAIHCLQVEAEAEQARLVAPPVAGETRRQ
jgi:1-acyl-sn-glycerol-3-phosphate acyltransferase